MHNVDLYALIKLAARGAEKQRRKQLFQATDYYQTEKATAHYANAKGYLVNPEHVPGYVEAAKNFGEAKAIDPAFKVSPQSAYGPKLGRHWPVEHLTRDHFGELQDAVRANHANELDTEHVARQAIANDINKVRLHAAGVPKALHDQVLAMHHAEHPAAWGSFNAPLVFDPHTGSLSTGHRAPAAGASPATSAPPRPASGGAGAPPPPGTGGGAAAAAGTRPRAPRTPVPPGHFDTYKGRYAAGAAAVGLGALALHHYGQRKHEAEAAALHDAAKTASDPKLPKEVADPFGQLNVHMSQGADTGALVGSVLPLAGSAIGGLIGKGVGAIHGIGAHHEATTKYEAETGKRLAFPARHPYSTAALASVGLFPVGAAPMGPAIAMGLAHATRPKGADPEVDKHDVLSHPYAYMSAKQAPGQMIGAGVGGTLGTVAGRYYGEHHLADHAKQFEDAVAARRAASPIAHAGGAAAAARFEEAAAHAAKQLAAHRIHTKYGLGIGGAIAGTILGSSVGAVPGILSTMRSHSAIAAEHEKETGKRLPGLVKSPYVPYLASGVLATPLGLSGLKNKAFAMGVQYKMDPATKPTHSVGDDVHGFADYLHRQWFR